MNLLELRTRWDSTLRLHLFPQLLANVVIITSGVPDGPSGATRRESARINVLPTLPTPAISLGAGSPERHSTETGVFLRYKLPVANWQQFPEELFDLAPTLPPCGLNAMASRTWITIFTSAGTHVYGFCAFVASANLKEVPFAVVEGAIPPSAVYIEIMDRLTGAVARSNTIVIPR